MDAHTDTRPPPGETPPGATLPGLASNLPSAVLASRKVTEALDEIRTLLPRCTDTELVELISGLEDAKNMCSGIQARASTVLREIREEDCTNEAELTQAHRSTVSEIALARRQSPHQARILLGLATVLTREMPRTMAHLEAGRISEWTATLMARETACLSLPHRRQVDRELGEDLPHLSHRETTTRARDLAYALDAHSAVTRRSRAESDRRVTLRPAPDCMTTLTALLPVAQGVAVYASLLRAADSARASGDPRGKGQVMADTLITRTTGQTHAEDTPVEVQVVISDRSLLGLTETPARLAGHGPLPAHHARALLHGRPDSERAEKVPALSDEGAAELTGPASGRVDRSSDCDSQLWLRRLWADPSSGQLIAMESTRRLFPPGLRRFIATRDANTCRTPFCDAPISHIDHITPVRAGGPTTVSNGQGAACLSKLTSSRVQIPSSVLVLLV